MDGRRTPRRHLGMRVDHLVFPWNEAGTQATTLAAQAGYRSILKGPLNERDICRRQDDPLHIPRVTAGGDAERYLLSLPGRGCRSPERVLLAKMTGKLLGRS